MIRWAISVLLVLLVLLAGAWLPVHAVDVTLNPAVRYQTIRGWGATASGIELPTPLREQLLDAAVNELGLTHLRLEIPQREWENARNDDGDCTHLTPAAFVTTTTDEKVRAWVLPFKQRVEANGAPFTLYVSPSFFDGDSTGAAPVWLLYHPGEYAEWVTAYLLYLQQQHHLPADYYCIGNDNAFTPAVVRQMIAALGPRLRAFGLATKIQFPEGISSAASWAYLQAMQDNPAVWPYIGARSDFRYGGRSKRPFLRDIACAHGLPIGQTEYMGTTIDHLYDDLTLGGVSDWEHYVLAYYGNTPGSGNYYTVHNSLSSFQRYGQYWNFRQVMHYVRPGAVRVAAVSADANLRVLAFTRQERMTVILLNTTDAQARTARLTGLPAGVYGRSQSVNSTAPVERGLQTIAAGEPLIVTVPAGSVVTVYPAPGGNQPPVITGWQANPSFLLAPASTTTLSAQAVDPELDPLTYQWTVTMQPVGAATTLANPSLPVTPAFGLTAAGQYVFTITVRDAAHTVSRDVLVTVFALNQAPVIDDLHHRMPVTITLPATRTVLRGSARDVEGDPLTYRWRVLRQPDGANATLENAATGQCTAANLTVAGPYVFVLEASDPTHTVSRELTVTVYPPDPGAVIRDITAAPATLRRPADSTQLTADITAPPGEVISPWWAVTRAPARATPTILTPGARETRVERLIVPGTYLFTLTVVSRTHATIREITVTVE